MARNGWTDERRARQAMAIRRWQPWQHSTGPRTEAGKASASRNADKGGKRAALRSELSHLRAMIREWEESRG